MCVEMCPLSNDFKPGGYHCSGGCINGNTGYWEYQTAWKRCGEIKQCKMIMKYTNGKYYLRKFNDRFESNSKCRKCEYVEYRCGGKKKIFFYFLFINIIPH